MKVEIKVPSMGESVSEAIVSQVLKTTGSICGQDEEILELETDKVNQVLYAPAAGQISWSVGVDDVVKMGQVIGTIDTSKAGAPPPTPPQPKASAPQPPSETQSARHSVEEFITESQTPPATPTPAKKSASGESRKKMSGLRKVIAEKLVDAKNKTAMLTTFNEIDMSTVVQIRNKEKEAFEKQHGVKLGFMSFFVKAVVAALKEYPQVNAYIDQDEIVSVQTYDIGIAVSTDKGLMVPVVKNCDQLTFAQIEKGIRDFSIKARDGKISVDDLRGGSFTITNGGTFGSLLSTPILNAPQSAILGMHAIVKRPVAIDDKIEIRPMMYVALSYDHRLIDGREAVLFLVNIKDNIENPSRLLLDL